MVSMQLSIVDSREGVQLVNSKYHRKAIVNCISYSKIFSDFSYGFVETFE